LSQYATIGQLSVPTGKNIHYP